MFCFVALSMTATIKPVTDLTFKDNLIRSTVYTIASCAIAVFFFVAILIVAIYRIHMRRSLLVARTSGHHSGNQFTANAQINSDCLYDNVSRIIGLSIIHKFCVMVSCFV